MSTALEVGMCEPCFAAWGDIGSGCATSHKQEQIDFATALARNTYGPEASLKEVGYFMDDADVAIAVLGPQDEWVFKPAGWHRHADGVDPLLEINGIVFRCSNGPMFVHIPDEDEEDGPVAEA